MTQGKLAAWCRGLTDAPTFQSLVVFVVVLNALLLGVELVPELAERFDILIWRFFVFSLGFFWLEITIRLCAELPEWRRFFNDPWNTFDLAIVVACSLPAVGPLAPVARLLRVLRILRLVSIARRSVQDSGNE